MKTQQQIVIDQDVIKLLGKKLYQNTTGNIVMRELIQNSVDACSNGGKVRINHDIEIIPPYNRLMTLNVDDTGCGMDEDRLINTFLSIGSSFKLLSNTSVGGFGIAKVSIFACDTWKVNTICGSIDDNLILNTSEKRKTGTKVTVTCDAEYNSDFTSSIILANNTSVPIIYNNHKVKNYTGTYESSIYMEGYHINVSLGKVINGSKHGLSNVRSSVIYRINGLVQFINWLYEGGEYNIIVDFNGIGYKPVDDNYPFTMSREGLINVVNRNVLAVIDRIKADKLSNEMKTESSKDKTRTKVIRDVCFQYVKSMQGLDNLYNRRIVALSSEIKACIDSRMGIDTLIGLTNKEDVVAYLDKDSARIMINPKSLGQYDSIEGLILSLWHLLCHELSHYTSNVHDEEFTCREGELSRLSSSKLAKNLNYLAKKYSILKNSDFIS